MLKENETITEITDADIEAILAAEDLVDEDREVVAAEADESTDEDIAAVVGELAVEEAVAQAYVEQEGTSESENPAEPKTAKPARMKTAGLKPSEVLRAKLGDKVASYLVFEVGEGNLSDTELDALVQTRLTEIDGLAKKVGEKAVNLILHVAAGQSLSGYTERAIEIAKNKGGFTIKDIYDNYRSRPYTEGTSSAQSSQMNQLLPFFKITTRKGGEHAVNQSSTYLRLL